MILYLVNFVDNIANKYDIDNYQKETRMIILKIQLQN